MPVPPPPPPLPPFSSGGPPPPPPPPPPSPPPPPPPSSSGVPPLLTSPTSFPSSSGDHLPPPPLPSFPLTNTEPPKVKKEESKSRSALLHEIQRGTRLRRVTQINDRSAPQIDIDRRRPIKDGGSSGNCSSEIPQALGNLFAEGFPVLRPVGQRDLAVNRTGKPPTAKTTSPPKVPVPLNNNGKSSGNFQITPSGPKQADESEASKIQSAMPTHSSITAPSAPISVPSPPPSPPPPPPPPPLPSPSGKPSLIFPPPPPVPPPFSEHPNKFPSPDMATAAASSQNRTPKGHLSPLHIPSPPPLPMSPPSPSGPPAKINECSSPSSSQLDLRHNSPPMPPPPPPIPGPPMSTFSSPRTSMFSPTSPTCNNTLNSNSDSASLLPSKSQLQKLPISSVPLPATLPSTQQAPAVKKRRQGRGGAKLMPPPVPPARSPTTELTSKCQHTQVSPWPPGTQDSDDFESKFTFHSVEDFPPPEEFKPCKKIYPSQEARNKASNPPLRTQAR